MGTVSILFAFNVLEENEESRKSVVYSYYVLITVAYGVRSGLNGRVDTA